MNPARISLFTLPVFLGISILALIPDANAQPVNSSRIVVSGGAGSPPDVITRIVATELSEHQNWRITVENRPGALSTLAIADVLKQPADGRTIMTLDFLVAAAPALALDRRLRLETDFAPVIKV